MDFKKIVSQGKKTALDTYKKKNKRATGLILVTFEAEEALRAEALKKVPNLSDYLRRCLIRLVHSDAEKKIEAVYDDVIDEALSSLNRTTDRPILTNTKENVEEDSD